jgi:sugar/nucleoside kinase (ribokinase family)
VAAARVTYFEGYLWDPPRAKDAIRLAADIAHRAGREVAIGLSDSFCVNRYRDEFLELMRSGTVDIVFANEAEALALYETDSLDQAVQRLGADTKRFALVTLGEAGCIIVEGPVGIAVPADPISALVDTTGAGDLFAAGFLRGYTAGLPHDVSARLGAIAAGRIIEQIGPRSVSPLRDLDAVRAILPG